MDGAGDVMPEAVRTDQQACDVLKKIKSDTPYGALRLSVQDNTLAP